MGEFGENCKASNMLQKILSISALVLAVSLAAPQEHNLPVLFQFSHPTHNVAVFRGADLKKAIAAGIVKGFGNNNNAAASDDGQEDRDGRSGDSGDDGGSSYAAPTTTSAPPPTTTTAPPPPPPTTTEAYVPPPTVAPTYAPVYLQARHLQASCRVQAHPNLRSRSYLRSRPSLQALRRRIRRCARRVHLGVRRQGRLHQQRLRGQGEQGRIPDQRQILCRSS